jgi:Fe-S-cluster containining protein
MTFVPWQDIADWHCKACGYCCKLYSVVLEFPEWLYITKFFGIETTVLGLDKFYIKRSSDGSCGFLFNKTNTYFCGLQSMKPDACKIWPFKVLSEPKYGEPTQSVFDYMGNKFYIYADTMCSGLRYGTPTWDFRSITMGEFIEISLGFRKVQNKSTRSANKHKQWGRKLFH